MTTNQAKISTSGTGNTNKPMAVVQQGGTVSQLGNRTGVLQSSGQTKNTVHKHVEMYQAKELRQTGGLDAINRVPLSQIQQLQTTTEPTQAPKQVTSQAKNEVLGGCNDNTNKYVYIYLLVLLLFFFLKMSIHCIGFVFFLLTGGGGGKKKKNEERQQVLQESTTNLIINYIPPNMNEGALGSLFSPYGTMQNIKIVVDPHSVCVLEYVIKIKQNNK
ncbi:hypothetical protein RFI_12496 [Reticulomyxa filosa]|uniref:RRM domain-containing protein n=1 Tax=Reticulomyxa filosa TaxID=46433 RepID=X6NF85_RETFI|nr:hypothetical protein RFI_12496 [Reticulomyxa filosa]|eukprot:ETO24661.1 hypothetical protein RFI_12496 [Reticulomyxa filosa]